MRANPGGRVVTTASAIRVLLADDHPVVRFGISTIINSNPGMVVVGAAVNGREAVDLFREHLPDVTLMDLRMPILSGTEAIQIIKKDFPESRFIVLTTYQGDEDIYKALTAGAQGYLLKGMSHSELLDAIQKVNSGQKYLPEPVRRSLEARPPASELSARELQILKLVIAGSSNRMIAETLGITEGTVKWHINIILSRLGVTDRTQAAVRALQRGIVELS